MTGANEVNSLATTINKWRKVRGRKLETEREKEKLWFELKCLSLQNNTIYPNPPIHPLKCLRVNYFRRCALMFEVFNIATFHKQITTINSFSFH